MKSSIQYSFRRSFSLFLLIFSGMGVRIFADLPGRIVIFALIMMFVNISDILKIKSSVWLRFLFIITAYVLFNLIKGTVPFVPMIVGWLSAIFVMSPYINGCNTFENDLHALTRFCVYYTLLHLILQLLFPFLLHSTDLPMDPKTIGYMFFYNKQQELLWLHRIQGFCWEPSNWNLLLNINLVIELFNNSKKHVLLTVFSIIAVMSTTGIVVMALIIVIYYIFFNNKVSIIWRYLFVALLISLFGGFVFTELSDKLASSSGNARYADLMVALNIAQTNPLMGADVDNISENVIALQTRFDAWEGDGRIDPALLEREGMVNSFAQLSIEFGIPIALLIIVSLFRNTLIGNKGLRYLMMISILMVLFGTPISRTGFFFLFVLSPYFVKLEKTVFITRDKS